MKPCKVICKNGEGRIANETTGATAFGAFVDNPLYPAPNIPDGEHLCVLQWQFKDTDGNWINVHPPKQYVANGLKTRQIWILASPEMKPKQEIQNKLNDIKIVMAWVADLKPHLKTESYSDIMNQLLIEETAQLNKLTLNSL